MKELNNMLKQIIALLFFFVTVLQVVFVERYTYRLTSGVIDKELYYQKYGIQNIHSVPDVREGYPLKNYVTYRSELHNGTENGTILIFCKIINNDLKEIFRIEDSFLLDGKKHYIERVIQNFTEKEVRFSVNEVISGKKRIVAECVYSLSKKKIISKNVYKHNFENQLISSSEYFERIQ